MVESFIARKGDRDFTEGAWVLVSWLPDELWAKVKSGELNGYSMAGFFAKYPVEVEAIIENKTTGVTAEVEFENVPKHDHQFTVIFDDAGEIIFGKAFSGDNDHDHNISSTTATDEAEGHAHRFVV